MSQPIIALLIVLAVAAAAGALYEWATTRERKHAVGHRDPVADGMFRMTMLDDSPYPTFIGTRSWCDGKPYWEDKTCRCTHEERIG